MRHLARIGIAGIAFLAIVLISAGLWIRRELTVPYYGASSAETFVTIPKGASTAGIAGLLAKNGVLHARLPFRIYLRLNHLERRIQAGEYRFAEEISPIQLAQMLVRGDVFFHSITIPEGLTAQETIDLLVQKGVGNRAEMEQALLRTDWIRDLDPAAQSLEGYLFPETYRFGRKDSSEAVVKAMVGEFRLRLARVLESSPLSAAWSIPRTITLASLIEKEVKQSEERPLVASVLINRLNKKMPLGCDATIIYAMKLAGIYNGRLGKADLRRESPYNSYLHRNLPPGPICNPGMEAIRAALNPARTEYLYYVSRNDGTHHFSKDLRSHINAVNRFQKAPARRNIRS